MSNWTYVNGVIRVDPLGRTQHEKRYILETVLDHLPVVTGSESDMEVYVLQKRGYNVFLSGDEFGMQTNNLIDSYGDKSFKHGSRRMQSDYLLVVEGSLRDRMFKQTYREFQNWLCRLAKRVSVNDVLAEVRGYDVSDVIRNVNDVYGKMFEYPSWSSKGTENWCEYLMWDWEE